MQDGPTVATRSPETEAEAKVILIVEDDPDTARSLADVLEADGYVISLANNGREALQRLEEAERPALILLDMMMPLMDGWTFRAEQGKRAEIAGIPVILMTADGHARWKAASIRAAGYLAKPVSIEHLLDQVARCCGGPRP